MKKKIEIVYDMPHDTFIYKCVECDKPMTFYYNGGELDQNYCCGRTYTTVSDKINLIIRKEV